MPHFTMSAFAKPDKDGHRFVARSIGISNEDASRVLAWCFGEFTRQMGKRWLGDGTIFWFRDDADAMHFKLRWC